MSEALDAAFGGQSERLVAQLLDLERECVRCGMVYRERDNIGSWACRAFHPGANFVTAHERVLPCCGQPRSAIGCVRADHTDYYEYGLELERVSEPVAEAVRAAQARAARKPLPTRLGVEAWSFNATDRQWFVERVEPHAYSDSLARSAPRPACDARHFDGFKPEQVNL